MRKECYDVFNLFISGCYYFCVLVGFVYVIVVGLVVEFCVDGVVFFKYLSVLVEYVILGLEILYGWELGVVLDVGDEFFEVGGIFDVRVVVRCVFFFE